LRGRFSTSGKVATLTSDTSDPQLDCFSQEICPAIEVALKRLSPRHASNLTRYRSTIQQ
jgi:hypothetical protein